MPTIQHGEVELYYESHGEGEPIVWIPGTGLVGSGWRRQVDEFARNYRCLTVDLRGSGRTVGGEANFTVSDLAQDVAALMDELGVTAHVVGFSLGSAVVQELALRRPDLVRSMVLLATWSSTAREHHIRRHFGSRLYALERGPLDVFAKFAFWMSAPSVVDDDPELQKRVEAEVRKGMSDRPVGLAAQFRADLAHETYDRLGEIACPTLVLYGAEDLVTLPAYNRRVANLISGAKHYEVAGAGHLVAFERPEQVNGQITEFYSRIYTEAQV
jgi:3-oxoadipate enol-lactonase